MFTSTGSRWARSTRQAIITTIQQTINTVILTASVITTALTNIRGQYPGSNTNNNATAGNIGEVIVSNIAVGSAVTVTSGTSTNITGINLTPGDWDLFGSISTNPAGTTTTSIIQASTNATGATLVNPALVSLTGQTIAAGVSTTLPIPMQRVSISTTTTYFLVANITFATSTMTAYGYILGRRAR